MTKAPEPSVDLIRDVRVGFIKRGETLAGWCRANQVQPTSARQALTGSWDGPKGRALRARICREAGVTGSNP